VSAEETFTVDLTDRTRLNTEVDLLATRVGSRLRAGGLSARTVTIKVRHYDFTTITRSATRAQPTDDSRLIAHQARRLLAEIDTSSGIRLLGVGVTTLADFVQDDLFGPTADPVDPPPAGTETYDIPTPAETAPADWRPGQDVRHDDHGAGWVWGRGRQLVTVRFEGPGTPPGPVRTFAADDPGLHPAEPPGWSPAAG
jgi:DNA polymerase-4